MRSHLREVADVTDVIAFAILIYILIDHGFPRNSRGHIKGFENGAAISSATTKVVHFSTSWSTDKGIDKACHIKRVNIVTHLFALVAVNIVLPSLQIAFDQITQEPMQLNTGMVGTSQTSAT